MEIENKIPYLVAGKKVTKFVIQPIAFVDFVEIAVSAGSAKNYRAALKSSLLRHRTKAVSEDGTHHEITAEILHAMPRPVAMPLVKFFDTEGNISEDESEEQKAERLAKTPKILTDGDGITSPVLIKLGTPIESAGKSISELEFVAKTYGDVEAVLAETDDLSRTVALIKTLAKPVGMLSLPSWAVGAVTIADGIFLEQNVLPRFLE